MTDTRERLRELIQLEIDGALTPEESRELLALLRADSDGRELRETLSLVARRIEALEPIEPPDDLIERVMSNVRQAARPSFARRTPAPASPSRRDRRRRIASHIYAVAAGILLGFLSAPAILHLTADGGGTAESAVTGSMLPPGPAEAWRVVSREATEAPAPEAGLVIRSRDDELAVEVEVAGPGRVELRWDASLLHFAGFSREMGRDPFTLGPDRIVIDAAGDQQFTLILLRRTLAPVALELTLNEEPLLIGSVVERISKSTNF